MADNHLKLLNAFKNFTLGIRNHKSCSESNSYQEYYEDLKSTHNKLIQVSDAWYDDENNEDKLGTMDIYQKNMKDISACLKDLDELSLSNISKFDINFVNGLIEYVNLNKNSNKIYIKKVLEDSDEHYASDSLPWPVKTKAELDAELDAYMNNS